MEFRRAGPEDAEAILQFWQESGASVSATDDLGSVRRITTNPGAVLLLAVARGDIVGSLLGTFDGWRGNLYRLVVAPDLRRRGIGRRLVREVERIFDGWGVRKTSALVEVDRPWAAQFWSSVGYPADDRIVRHAAVHSAPNSHDDPGPAFDRRAAVILVSADAEWRAVKQHVGPEHVDRTPYGECFVHRIADEDLFFCHGGWGKISAAASAEYAIHRWQPDVLINLGTCGGIEGLARRGEKILVTRTITYDIGESMGDSAEAIRFYTTDIDLTWLDESFPVEVRQLPIVSGDRDLVPSEVPGLVDRFDAVVADWESGAIAYVASRRTVPVLILRAVSDLVSPQSGETIGAHATFEAAAAAAMRGLLDDLTTLVPYVMSRRRITRS